jgi:uncharacterized Zn finger protein
MKATGAARFDPDTLRQFAGDKVFSRGKAYFRDGQVQILLLEKNRVLAQVSGSEDYRTELNGRGETLEGHCSCRAFEDWGFCKHMVAVGLAANAAGTAEDGGALSRIRDHLKTKSIEALVEVIVKIAERDLQLFRRLELDAATSHADDAALETRLRKALDGATRPRTYIDYSSAPDWAAGVGEVLDGVESIASDGRVAVALKLARRAIDRIESAMGSIDDSDGHCGALLHRAADIHLAAADAVRPDPVELARDLFALEMKDGYDVFYGVVERYAEVLGEPGLVEYRRLAETAWQKLPGRSARSDEFSTDRGRLIAIMDFFAERDGDTDARIALRAKDLSSPYQYLQIAEFCVANGRKQDALRYAEDGLWTFEDARQDSRLVLFAADLLTKVGRNADGEAHLWRAFDREPSLKLYTGLRRVGGEAAAQRALGLIEQRCVQHSRTGNGGLADLLIECQMQEKAFDAAWASIAKFGGSIHVKERLAKATEKTHANQVIKVYQESIDRLATSAAYAEAAKLVARVAKLQSASAQAAYLANLRERHGRKRNFMKLLG